MILLKNFSFIHLPKSGGSFVEKILRRTFGRNPDAASSKRNRLARRLHQFVTGTKPWCYWSVAPQMFFFGYAELLKHGFADDLPPSRKKGLLLGVFRAPLDRYISQYEFRWLARSGATHSRSMDIQKKHPGWPGKESFRENFEIRNEFFSIFQCHLPVSERVGIQTEEFVSFFCKNPAGLLSEGARGLTLEKVAENLYDIHLLNMESLNSELALFLQAFGVSEQLLDIVRNHERVMPGSKGREVHGNLGDYYDAQLLEEAVAKEKIAIHFWQLMQQGCRKKSDFLSAIST
jgi:hypothetical protein